MKARIALLSIGFVAALAPGAHAFSVLGGTAVWVEGEFGSQTLMQRSPDGTVAPVQGAPVAKHYGSVDLGIDAEGKLVLTYTRCVRVASRCAAMRDDLHGARTRFRGLEPARCSLSTAPAIWRSRMVYGLLCTKSSGRTRTVDAAGSGLYFKNGDKAARRLGTPREARRAGADVVSQVDVRKAGIAAIAADISHYAWYRWARRDAPSRTWLVATSEGDTDGRAAGLTIGARNHTFTLATYSHPEEPNSSVITRQTEACLETQVLKNPEGPEEHEGYPAVDIAADGEKLYLLVPGKGMVSHTFVADRPC